MPRYLLDIGASAQRELDRLDNAVFARIDAKILLLSENPRPAGCKKLKGYRDLWRLRVGVWRVIYSIDDSARVVRILHVAHRRDVYEGDWH